MDRFIVISSDCHAGLPPSKYREYLDPQYREMFDMALPLEVAAREKVEKNFLIKEINEEWRKGNEAALTGAWDHAERIKMLDKDGIAGEIIFPDGITERNAPPFGVGLSPPVRGQFVPPSELIWAGSRAHNRWLVELCQMDPTRHHGVGVIPLLWDVEESVKEVEWLVKRGIRSVMIPTVTGQFDGYNNTKYDPFWAACQANDVIINFHSGAAPMEDFFGHTWTDIDPRTVGGMGVFVCETFFWTYRPLVFMIWGGVFERFPKLRAVVTEVGTGWMLPPLLRLLDHNYFDVQFSAKLGDFKSHLSMSPTEYFRRNVGIGASCIGRPDVELRHQLGLNQIMWGSDYPHPEGTWPVTQKHIFDAFVGIPEQEIALMLGENAIKFYGFDREKLVPIAERIGPKKSDFIA
jgi:predicted TIM-barrel fold metal-dependent hydrolase